MARMPPAPRPPLLDEWQSWELHTLAHTNPSLSLHDYLKEAIDAWYHRHVARLQMETVRQLRELADSAGSYLLQTAEGALQTGDLDAYVEEKTIRAKHNDALYLLRRLRCRRIEEIRQWIRRLHSSPPLPGEND